MNIKSIFWASVLGSVTLFVLGYIMHIVLVNNFDLTIKSVVQIERDSRILPAIILMDFLYALLITIIYSLWAGIRSFKRGLKIGAFIGLIIGLCVGLEYFATTYLLSTTGILLNAITVAFRFALAGGVIAYILGRTKD